jgi:aerobic carbon-monoxide dehydrogenase small subunit
MSVTFTVNGEPVTAPTAGFESLLRVLRDVLSLPGSKNACEQGECGSCSVIMDGELVCACLVMIGDCEGADIETVEGLADGDVLHEVQAAMVAEGGVQCGFCTPGIVVAGAYLLDQNPNPSEEQIREALSGNLCRCTGYGRILEAFQQLAASTER